MSCWGIPFAPERRSFRSLRPVRSTTIYDHGCTWYCPIVAWTCVIYPSTCNDFTVSSHRPCSHSRNILNIPHRNVSSLSVTWNIVLFPVLSIYRCRSLLVLWERLVLASPEDKFSASLWASGLSPGLSGPMTSSVLFVTFGEERPQYPWSCNINLMWSGLGNRLIPRN